MKGRNVSKIIEGGCNNVFLLYMLFAVVSSIVLLVVILIALLITKGTVNVF